MSLAEEANIEVMVITVWQHTFSSTFVGCYLKVKKKKHQQIENIPVQIPCAAYVCLSIINMCVWGVGVFVIVFEARKWRAKFTSELLRVCV